MNTITEVNRRAEYAELAGEESALEYRATIVERYREIGRLAREIGELKALKSHQHEWLGDYCAVCGADGQA